MAITVSNKLLTATIELLEELVVDPDISFGPAYGLTKKRKEQVLKDLKKLRKAAKLEKHKNRLQRDVV